MDRATHIERILQDMEQRLGHEWIAEPINQLTGSSAFIPLWNAYRDRNAADVLRELDKLCASYWFPMAAEKADAEEIEEDIENEYRRRMAITGRAA